MTRRKLVPVSECRPPPDPTDDKLWQDIRKALYKPMTVQNGARRERMAAIDAYVIKLVDAAARGDAAAMREQLALYKRLRNPRLPLVDKEAEGSIDLVGRAMAKQAALSRIGQTYQVMIYARIIDEIVVAFSQVHGELKGWQKLVPLGFDKEMLKRHYEDREKRRREARKSSSYKVGYGKPPEATRWRTGQSGNPGGRKSTRQTRDVFYDSLLDPITVLRRSGGTEKSAKIGVAATQALNGAMQGDMASRRLVRILICELDERCLLRPPEPKPRRRRLTGEQAKMQALVTRVAFAVGVPRMKQQLVDMFTHRYGPVPLFTLEWERTLPKSMDEVEGYKEWLAQSADAKAA